ncbi:PH domain-containing protein [uncultured Clostridium sp.]|uniref:PH domain-containing protein n=1 Tax=uncultured Clostridium sp. TaxID=59620 RepID=UPI0025E63639|nr:PH domain-containing protein [uncultured Clostridium sp.]
MKIYKQKLGVGSFYLIFMTLILNFGFLFISMFIKSYMIKLFGLVSLICIDIYQLYYIIISFTTRYIIDEDSLIINTFFYLRNIKIPMNEIIELLREKNKIEGMILDGYGMKKFAFGRIYIENIGTTRAYISNFENVLLIKTVNGNFAISPIDINGICNEISIEGSKKVESKKVVPLYKDKYFLIPFITASCLIIILMVIPLILGMKDNYALNSMPLSFNERFEPIKWGTYTQFTVNQISYGLITSGILICMLLTSNVYSKYDRKSCYKYIYLPLIVAVVLLFMQIQILSIYYF